MSGHLEQNNHMCLLVIQVFYNSMRLGHLKYIKHKDIDPLMKDVKLGSVILQALEMAKHKFFENASQPLWQLDPADLKQQGEFSRLVSAGINILQTAIKGSRGAGRGGVQSKFKVAGFTSEKRDEFLKFFKNLHGSTEASILKKDERRKKEDAHQRRTRRRTG